MCLVCDFVCVTVLQVRNGETPDEATAVFQYTVYDKRKPLVDDQNNKMRKVRGSFYRLLVCSRPQCSWKVPRK